MFILFVDTIKKVRTSYISYFVEIYSALFHLELTRFINENFHCLSRINITTEICQFPDLQEIINILLLVHLF